MNEKMGLCPICGKMYCDHTAKERGQTNEEMMAPLTPKEEEKKRLNDNEDRIDIILQNPKIVDYINWEGTGNRIEGHSRILVRNPDGTFTTTDK